MAETWQRIPGFELLYEVSDTGNVRSVDRVITDRNGRRVSLKGRPIRLQYRPDTGYWSVKLSNAGVTRNWYVHRLVLMAFRGLPEVGQEGCHNNGVRTDNRLSNLRWDSHLANVGDSITHGSHRSIGSYNGDKTHCHRGHEFNAENTFIRPEGRSCKECRRINERTRYHARKAS